MNDQQLAANEQHAAAALEGVAKLSTLAAYAEAFAALDRLAAAIHRWADALDKPLPGPGEMSDADLQRCWEADVDQRLQRLEKAELYSQACATF